ncbi:uncharacterized protein VTP21DRAFT_11744, partial [Calcarisporiella thermophila]
MNTIIWAGWRGFNFIFFLRFTFKIDHRLNNHAPWICTILACVFFDSFPQ